MSIESTYGRCAISFQSRSALHSHIKFGCNTLARVALAKTVTDLVFARPILRSVARFSAPVSGFAFRR